MTAGPGAQDRRYLDPGDRLSGRQDPPRPCRVLTWWGPGGGPRNVLVRYSDGSQAVIPVPAAAQPPREAPTFEEIAGRTSMRQIQPETLAELLATVKRRERQLERRISACIEAGQSGRAEDRAAALRAVVKDGRSWFGASEELASAIHRAGRQLTGHDDDDLNDDQDGDSEY